MNKERIRQRHREWRKKNPERDKILKERWRLKNLKKIKLKIKYSKEKNPERFKEYNRKYEAKNREKVLAAKSKWNRENKEYQKIYLKNNPEKFRAASLRRRASKISNSTPEQIKSANIKIAEMLKIEFTECPYCKTYFKTSEMEVEHIFPLIRGGSHSAENITMACEKCNGSKGDKILFFNWIPPYAKK